MGTTVYSVDGMTCGHCVSAVTQEVGKVPGVTGVEVDLTAGTATVTGEGFTDDAVIAAVDEAGFTATVS
ncbi:heavy-metal-associated domain-containing protein [Corynebacterium mendelii]|uniref:Heavy-metal-associated domain-containing protein n=1 Tax=Corynebacterium mendelii TaxID=2765362 RepID=A0A939E0U5_9CORY|nr:heavy-metal-associated domain-containing protein [Corynebacterium mendelii]MBN9644366.1 heavy-metal-associated domain-containing protein [Corynebacterium mendelii]